MTKLCYIPWEPTNASWTTVAQAEGIIQQYAGQGYVLTLRQLYYQFVARDLLPNTERSYKNLGNLITKARNAGLISWKAIEDRGRELVEPWLMEDDEELVRRLQHNIRFDRWSRMDNYIEVWVEKEALGNVIAKACRPYHVPHLSCKGYLSASEAWRAGQRLAERVANGQDVTIIHLGDHDPSGIDMTRDNQDRLRLYSEEFGVKVHRIALTMDQIDEHSPPPNPAKLSDARASGYIERYGYESWELDALEPRVLEDLIQETIDLYIDNEVWNSVKSAEDEMIWEFAQLHEHWDEVKSFLHDRS